ncbi:hypothetical protein D3C80_1701300 [compost metagenome]
MESLDDAFNYDFVINLVNLIVIGLWPTHCVDRATKIARMHMGGLCNGKNGFTLYRCGVVDRSFRYFNCNP